MKVSKRDFLKLLGGGSAAAGAAVVLGGPGPAKNLHIGPADGGPGVRPGQAVAPVPSAELVPLAEKTLDYSHYDVVTERPFYDRVRLPAGAYLPKSFHLGGANPIGTGCPVSGFVKTLADTNLFCCGYFPPPCSFLLRRLYFVVPDYVPAGDAALIRSYTWEFLIADRVYCSAPLALFEPGRGPVPELPAAANFDSPTLAARLLALMRAARSSKLPPITFGLTAGLYIPSLANFSLRLHGEGGRVGRGPLELYSVMEGLYSTAVM